MAKLVCAYVRNIRRQRHSSHTTFSITISLKVIPAFRFYSHNYRTTFLTLCIISNKTSENLKKKSFCPADCRLLYVFICKWNCSTSNGINLFIDENNGTILFTTTNLQEKVWCVLCYLYTVFSVKQVLYVYGLTRASMYIQYNTVSVEQVLYVYGLSRASILCIRSQ